jgi:hypothetical protein
MARDPKSTINTMETARIVGTTDAMICGSVFRDDFTVDGQSQTLVNLMYNGRTTNPSMCRSFLGTGAGFEVEPSFLTFPRANFTGCEDRRMRFWGRGPLRKLQLFPRASFLACFLLMVLLNFLHNL